MTHDISSQVARKIYEAYGDQFPRSRAAHSQLCQYIPGGTTRSLSYFKPFPLHISHGRGARVFTPGGRSLLDVTNAYGALVHGHGDPHVVDAVQRGIEKGSQYAAPTRGQYRLAKLLCDRVPGFEKIRFTNSGTEATLFALRTARAFTGKDKILKMVGGYHGTHDSVATSTRKDAVTAGIPLAMTQDVLEVPFNDIGALERAVVENADELAAVIMEPFLGAGGVIAPCEGFLETARRVTRAHGVVLIFDEIFSFRVDTGGCQQKYGVIPDLTCVGKVVGGGLPMGGFGGKANIMDAYCHEARPQPLYHSGTFNGCETVMQAGFAAMEKYDAPAVERLNGLGEMLQRQLVDLFHSLGLNIQSNGVGSIVNIHFVGESVDSAEGALKSEAELHHLFHLSLLTRGIYTIPRGLFILSTPMAESDIQTLVYKIRESLKELLPLMEEKYGHLLR